MEGTNDMPSASSSETQPIAEIGEESEVLDTMAIFGSGGCNGIAHNANSIPRNDYA